MLKEARNEESDWGYAERQRGETLSSWNSEERKGQELSPRPRMRLRSFGEQEPSSRREGALSTPNHRFTGKELLLGLELHGQ
jgi:hypothetical protein